MGLDGLGGVGGGGGDGRGRYGVSSVVNRIVICQVNHFCFSLSQVSANVLKRPIPMQNHPNGNRAEREYSRSHFILSLSAKIIVEVVPSQKQTSSITMPNPVMAKTFAVQL